MTASDKIRITNDPGAKPIIEPAKGYRAMLLHEIGKLAQGLHDVLERELSGVRDDDGYWHGSDPLGHYIGGISELWQKLEEFDQVEWLWRNGPPQPDDWNELPF